MLKKILRYLDPAITLSFKDMELGGRTKEDTPDKISAEEAMDMLFDTITYNTSRDTLITPKVFIDFTKIKYTATSDFLDEFAKRLASTVLHVKTHALLFKDINIFFKYRSLKEEFDMYYNKYKNSSKK